MAETGTAHLVTVSNITSPVDDKVFSSLLHLASSTLMTFAASPEMRQKVYFDDPFDLVCVWPGAKTCWTRCDD